MPNNKHLLKTTDDFQVDSFLYKLQKDNPGYTCKKYYDPEDLLERVTGCSLFEDDKEISVLMDLSADGVKILGNCAQELTSDPIVLVQRKAITKTKAYTNLTVDFEVRQLESLKAKDCVVWVANTLKKRGIKHSKDIPDVIVNCVGTNQYALLNEIDKMCMVSDDLSLDSSNIKKLLASSPDVDYFSFIDHLTHLRLGETLAEFDKIDPSTYVKFLGFIISQLEKFYKISIYKSQKYTPEEIADIVGIPAFILKTKVLTIYSFVPKTRILKMIDIFLDLSEKLRSTKFNKKTVFESYLLKIFKK